MPTFILVHGTFASRADWPALTEHLRKAFERRGEQTTFVEVKWTGNNSVAARQDAAKEVLRVIDSIRDKRPDDPIFAIGHSHGGSALAYLMKQSQEAREVLSGCVFLSTPFVAIRPRIDATRLMFALLFFPTLLVNYFINSAQGVVSSINPVFIFYQRSWPEILVVLVPIFASIIFGALTAQAERSVSSTIPNQTVDLPSHNYLFIRFAGDEAAALLGASQFVAWAGNKISSALRKVLGGSSSWSQLTYPLLWTCPIIMAFYMFLRFITPSSPEQTYVGNVILLLRLLGSVFSDPNAMNIIFSSLFLVSAAVSIAFVTVFCICIAVFVSQAVAARLFGWTSFISGFVVELAIEPLPFGKHSLVTMDWTSDPSGLSGIVHSWTYAHPVAIQHIEEWVLGGRERNLSSP